MTQSLLAVLRLSYKSHILVTSSLFGFVMRVLLLLMLSFISHPCFSQEEQEPPKPRCDDGEYHGQSFQNDCANKRYRAADKKLNETYQSVLRSLGPQAKKKLRAEQRVWLKQLEPRCEEAIGPRMGAGNMWPMEFYDCKQTETSKRIEALKRWPKQ
jgi:uncharacterized protein YecT (DUF1311 family)